MLKNILTVCVVFAVIVTLCPLPAFAQGGCDPEFNNFWTGGAPIPIWSDSANWTLGLGVPEECHNVFIDIAGTDIHMDVGTFRYPVLSFTPQAAGDLRMGAAAGGGSTDINVVQDAISGTIQNQYVIHVGSGDEFASGTPFVNSSSYDSVVEGFLWDLNGGRVGVAGTIGPGKWNATDATIRVGYVLPETDFDLDVEITGVAGTIDSGIGAGAAIPAPSTWTLQDVSLRAKRCQNLDVWTVLQSGSARIRTFQFHKCLQPSETA